jgi:hypothetical protein
MMDNHNADVSTHETAHNRVQFVGESQGGESFEELSCFTPDQTIGVDGKRGDVFALSETGLQVLLLFLALLRGQNFVGVLGPIRLGIRICHLDVKNNDVRPMGPEASVEQISPLFIT